MKTPGALRRVDNTRLFHSSHSPGRNERGKKTTWDTQSALHTTFTGQQTLLAQQQLYHGRQRPGDDLAGSAPSRIANVLTASHADVTDLHTRSAATSPAPAPTNTDPTPVPQQRYREGQGWPAGKTNGGQKREEHISETPSRKGMGRGR